MAITLQATPLNSAVDTIADLFNGGSVEFLQGATVLATLTLVADVFPAAAGGSTTANTTTDPTLGVPVVATGSVSTTGTCDGFQVKDSGGTVILTGNCTVVGGGGSFELSDLAFSSGDLLVISTMIYSQPATGA